MTRLFDGPPGRRHESSLTGRGAFVMWACWGPSARLLAETTASDERYPARRRTTMVKVLGVDHLVISVGNFARSKAFYAPLMQFLGFDVEADYASMMGWSNGKTLFWIAAADTQGKKHKYRKGDIGFHHYAFRLASRKDVDALQAFLEEQETEIVDPAGEYYDDYYAVFFLDPDGMKLEGMKWGERHEKAARARAARKRHAVTKRS
jgi:catechol 2,3-dioxygenase-like lactoylglutathione lyase family enzyme